MFICGFLTFVRVYCVPCRTCLNVASTVALNVRFLYKMLIIIKFVSSTYIWKDFSEVTRGLENMCNSWKLYYKGVPSENGGFVHLRFWFPLL